MAGRPPMANCLGPSIAPSGVGSMASGESAAPSLARSSNSGAMPWTCLAMIALRLRMVVFSRGVRVRSGGAADAGAMDGSATAEWSAAVSAGCSGATEGIIGGGALKSR